MIVTVHTLAQKRQFLAAARRDPLLHALLGRDLTLWADNPGAPVRLFLAGEAALSVSSNSAWLAGAPDDPEELASFLRFVGVENLYTAARDPATDFRLAGRERGYCLPPGRTLPQPPLPQGFVLDTDLGAGAAAGLLFPYRRVLFPDLYRSKPWSGPAVGTAGCPRPVGRHCRCRCTFRRAGISVAALHRALLPPPRTGQLAGAGYLQCADGAGMAVCLSQ